MPPCAHSRRRPGTTASQLGASGVARWSLPPCHVPAAPAAAAKTRSRDRAPRRVSPAGPPAGVGSGHGGGRREGAAVSLCPQLPYSRPWVPPKCPSPLKGSGEECAEYALREVCVLKERSCQWRPALWEAGRQHSLSVGCNGLAFAPVEGEMGRVPKAHLPGNWTFLCRWRKRRPN